MNAVCWYEKVPYPYVLGRSYRVITKGAAGNYPSAKLLGVTDKDFVVEVEGVRGPLILPRCWITEISEA